MKYDLVILAMVAVVALVGMSLASGVSGQFVYRYDQGKARRANDMCVPGDVCPPDQACIQGVCRIVDGPIQVLAGQLCTKNVPCRYGLTCLDGRCAPVS